jgi:hypoxia-inducible factor 1-alpha inhibitor (HIF hydroxylase)
LFLIILADRQSQIDFYNPDLNKFPNFNKLIGQEAILNPNEILYIPEYVL